MRAWTRLVLALSALWVGCGDESGGASADGNRTGGQGAAGMLVGHGGSGAAGAPTGAGGVPAAGKGGSGGAAPDAGTRDVGENAGPLRLAIVQKAVPPEGQDHVCVTLPLPNESTVWVKSIHATLGSGSHHLIVDRRAVDSVTQTEPAPCSPTMGGDGTRLIIAQQSDTVLAMPEGTGLRIEPHQPIFLQLHYINAGEVAVDIEGVVELELWDDAARAPIEVQSTFTGSTDITLPKHESGMSEFFLKPGGTPAEPWRVFALTSHTHSLGVEATIERVASVTAPDNAPIHRSLDWHEPPLTTFDPTLDFTGSDGLRLRCKYVNDTDVDVQFGTRFEDEMCFMWLYYFRYQQEVP